MLEKKYYCGVRLCPPARPDDYWAAYIVPINEATDMQVVVDITTATGRDEELDSLVGWCSRLNPG